MEFCNFRIGSGPKNKRRIKKGQKKGQKNVPKINSLPRHAEHARPPKYQVVYNSLSFYSVILKLGTKKELVVLKNLIIFLEDFCILSFLPKFGFANMGYLMLLSERTFYKDLKTEKKF